MQNNNNNLKKLNKLLETIGKINQQLLIAKEEKKLCQKICQYLVNIKGYKFVWLGLKKISTEEITPFAIAGDEKDFIEDIKKSWQKYGFNESPTSKAIKNGKPFLVKDLKNEKRFVPWDKQAVKRGFLSAIVLPVKYYDEVIGSIHIYSDIKDYFIDEEVKFLKEVAGDISVGIKGLRNEKKILESKKEFEELFKRVNSCIAIYEAKDNGNDFIFKDFNKAAERTDKIKREDIIGKSVLEVFPGVKDFGLFDVFKRVYKTAKPENHPLSIYKDKRISGWRENFVYKLPTGAIVAIYNDLTDKKKAEEEIKNLAKFPSENPEPVGRIDFNGKILYANEVLKMRMEKWKHISGGAPLPIYNIVKNINKNKSYKNETRDISMGDKIYEVTIIPLKDAGYINIYGRDITDRKKAEDKLKESYKKLKDTFDGILKTLSSIVEIRDPYTSGHQKRVAQIVKCISNEMGLDSDTIEKINTAALIHDIGKMNIPPSLLSRPGELSEIEFSMIKTHSQTGYDILKNVNFPGNIAEIILQHHEREDGSGYPSGLKGDRILLEAKIMAVADVVEAMSSHRPYRPARGITKALEEIKKGSGKIYDDKVVKICLKVFKEGKIKLEST